MSMVNKVKSLGARVTMGEEDIRSRLERDHDRFKELAQEMVESTRAARRKALLGELKPIVTAHARAEERIVYNALITVRAPQETHTLAREGYVEHSLVDELLAKLSAIDSGSDEWLAHARVLRELLNTHILEEQSETFAELGAHFDGDELDAMGARFERERASILRSGSPARQRVAAERAGSQQRTTRGSSRGGARKKAATRVAGTSPARRSVGASARKRASTGNRRKGSSARSG